MTRVTLQHLAEALDLSTYAVSRALSGKDGVSEATRERVRALAARMGYARPEISPGRRDIALIFYDLDVVNSELRMQIQNGVQREAHRLRKPVRLQWSHLPEQVADMARNSAGLLLVGAHEKETLATVGASGVPVVRLGWVDPLEQVDQVIATDREGGQAVLLHLIALGHRSIACVNGDPSYRGRRERFQGAREVVEQHSDVELHPMAFDEAGGFGAALDALHRTGAHPSAFFCAHDGLALTVVSELLARGVRIPDEVSVVGFGDFSAAAQISPQLTTVRINGAEMGAVALHLLLERIEGRRSPESPARRIMIACRIVERRSTGPCRVVARSRSRKGARTGTAAGYR